MYATTHREAQHPVFVYRPKESSGEGWGPTESTSRGVTWKRAADPVLGLVHPSRPSLGQAARPAGKRQLPRFFDAHILHREKFGE